MCSTGWRRRRPMCSACRKPRWRTRLSLCRTGAAGYHAAHNGQKTYNGVAILRAARWRTSASTFPICRRAEARAGGDHRRRAHRLRLHAQRTGGRLRQVRVQAALAGGAERPCCASELAALPQLALLGDYNIAPDDRDVHDPVAWKDQILCSEPERAAFRQFLGLGLAMPSACSSSRPSSTRGGITGRWASASIAACASTTSCCRAACRGLQRLRHRQGAAQAGTAVRPCAGDGHAGGNRGDRAHDLAEAAGALYPVLANCPPGLQRRIADSHADADAAVGNRGVRRAAALPRLSPSSSMARSASPSSAASGRELPLYRVLAGESCIISSSCLLGHADYNASGVTEGATTLALLPRAAVRRNAGRAGFRDFVFALFSERMAELMQLVEEVAFRKLDQRLAALLLGKGRMVHHPPATGRRTGQRARDGQPPAQGLCRAGPGAARSRTGGSARPRRFARVASVT
jgi:hypothetical protein